MKRRNLLVTLIVAATIGGAAQMPAPRAHAAPAPEVEYTYDVAVRRHYSFPNNDGIGYGHGICDKAGRGEGYAQVMGDVKNEVTPNDEFAANYLVSNAVNLLCPAQVWQLRNSAAGYQPPPEQSRLIFGLTTRTREDTVELCAAGQAVYHQRVLRGHRHSPTDRRT